MASPASPDTPLCPACPHLSLSWTPSLTVTQSPALSNNVTSRNPHPSSFFLSKGKVLSGNNFRESRLDVEPIDFYEYNLPLRDTWHKTQLSIS